MRVLMLSKALVVGTYQRKAEELARVPGLALTVAVPPYWREGRNRIALERAHTAGYDLAVLPMVLNGHYHVHFYRRLGALLDVVTPDVLHIDEEHYNLATFQAMRLAVRRRIPALFFTWQNIGQRYPPPFSLMERYVLDHAACAMAGNVEAADAIRSKGFRRPISVIPQFGIDPSIFSPAPSDNAHGHEKKPFVIGLVGRVEERKGVLVLLRALAGLPGDWELRIVGAGEAQSAAEALAAHLGIAGRVAFLGSRPSTTIPGIMRELDLLVGPSLTTPRWKEQFGRMLVEAMACGVPVIGSSSGEIPHVIGDAGIVVPEGDSAMLRRAIEQVMRDDVLRRRLAGAGRARVLAEFTQEAIACRTAAVYQEMVVQ